MKFVAGRQSRCLFATGWDFCLTGPDNDKLLSQFNVLPKINQVIARLSSFAFAPRILFLPLKEPKILSTRFSRRGFLIAAPVVLAGCVTNQPNGPATPAKPKIPAAYLAMYAAIDTEPHPVPAIDLTTVDPQFWRRVVNYYGPEAPGTEIGRAHV